MLGPGMKIARHVLDGAQLVRLNERLVLDGKAQTRHAVAERGYVFRTAHSGEDSFVHRLQVCRHLILR